MRSEYITWRGHQIFVTVTGQGDPLLLVPGLGNNIGMWVPFMEQFRNRRIIRLDAPGTGLSSTPHFPVTVPELADLDAIDASPVRCMDEATASKMIAAIDRIRRSKDTVGGVFEVGFRRAWIADSVDVLAHIDADDVGAFLGQPDRVFAALAPRRTRDERDLAGHPANRVRHRRLS